jgi:type I restriction enzyme S subunit
MTPEQLKSSILQYAIQGKLVEQRAEEGTGEELYQQIQEEKQRLIKEGKIKKEKPLPEIMDEEKSFDIPESWKWVKLGECTGYAQPKEKISPTDIKSNMWSLDLEDIQKESGNMLVKTMASERKIIGDKVIFHKGQVLYSKLRPYLKKILIAPDEGICTPELVPFDVYLISPEYLVYVLKSPHIDYTINAVTYGVKMPRVGTDTMINLLIPLPPLAEQHRIVAKIEELLPYVDRYAQSWKKLEHFNAKFPEDMKKSILQYAIQGKLVEQRAGEGTAEELYQQIKLDRENKIAQGLIKRDKRIEANFEEEELFDIPETWKWVTLGSILLKLTDGTHKTPKYAETGVKFVSVKDMSSGVLSLENTKFITEDEHKELYNRCNPQKGDMLLSKVGTTGVPAIIDTDEEFSLFVSVALLKYNHAYINQKYLYYLLQSPLVQKQAAENTRGVGNKNWVLDAISKTMIPLPPLAEQHRIVAKIEGLLPYCDRLVEK